MQTGCATVLVVALLVAACSSDGVEPMCRTGPVLRVTPTVGMADSRLAAPGNEQRLEAYVGTELARQGTGECPVPQVVQMVHPTWTSPDPTHLTVRNADDTRAPGDPELHDIVTCTGPTAGPVTLTATAYAQLEGTAYVASADGKGIAVSAAVQFTCK